MLRFKPEPELPKNILYHFVGHTQYICWPKRVAALIEKKSAKIEISTNIYLWGG